MHQSNRSLRSHGLLVLAKMIYSLYLWRHYSPLSFSTLAASCWAPFTNTWVGAIKLPLLFGCYRCPLLAPLFPFMKGWILLFHLSSVGFFLTPLVGCKVPPFVPSIVAAKGRTILYTLNQLYPFTTIDGCFRATTVAHCLIWSTKALRYIPWIWTGKTNCTCTVSKEKPTMM